MTAHVLDWRKAGVIVITTSFSSQFGGEIVIMLREVIKYKI